MDRPVEMKVDRRRVLAALGAPAFVSPRREFDPIHFGAVGDARHDDAATIQATHAIPCYGWPAAVTGVAGARLAVSEAVVRSRDAAEFRCFTTRTPGLEV